MKISVTILTKNSQKYLHEVLRSLAAFDEVVIYDTGSTDATLDIAQSYPNVVIFERPFEGFGPSHNKATDLAKNDWILSIDSDEIVTETMLNEIFKTPLNTQTVYSFPRENLYNRKVIRGCGWYPDRQYRLYNRTKTKFSDAQVHEQVITRDMQIVEMQYPIRHYSYNSISDFLTKMQLYSDLFAKQNTGKRKASVLTAIGHGSFAFFKSYFLKKGFLDGYEGYIISKYNGHTAFYKYLKLREANLRKGS
ncbi:MAG: glycosyltransferase family 2 protein [Parachlamydiales bacterium]|jgi:glycosyltransferase involved in cell wall biosynthesis